MERNEKIIEAFTEMAPRYAKVVDTELSRFWGWSYEGFVSHLVETIPVGEKEIILDVATGTGSIPYQLEMEGLSRRRIHELDITYLMLKHAKHRLGVLNDQEAPNLTCASAMAMPYKEAAFTQVICGLATHHMQVKDLLSESFRVLQDEGLLSIADAGGSIFWRIPGVKLVIRIAAFIYFTTFENLSRAWAETSAVSNVLSKEGWQALLADSGFISITIEKLRSKYFFIPSPLLIKAVKRKRGSVDEQFL